MRLEPVAPFAVDAACRWASMRRVEELLERRAQQRGRPRYLAELPAWLASGVAWRA